MSNFDKNFESHKAGFKQKFGTEWDKNPSLYLQYMQARYFAATAELLNASIIKLVNDNKEIKELLLELNNT